ncbi:mannose/fructose/N-acetylgalactosamine-specific phosphotransferase system component IID [Clostridium beijerinckii]
MGGNKLRYLTEGASVLGLLVIGGLVSKWTSINIPFVLSKYTQADGKEVVTTIQSVLDSLMPGLVPLLLTFLCMYLLKKNVNPLIIIFGLFAVGILGVACGILQ